MTARSMDYSIYIKEQNQRPVIAVITENNLTVHTIRGDDLETVEAEARTFIAERTPQEDQHVAAKKKQSKQDVRFQFREQWLTEAMRHCTDLFVEAGYEVPTNIRATCGWPSRSALSNKKRRIGECWSSSNSKDNTFEIIISLGLDDPVKVLGVLIHEMVHAVVGLEAGHKKPFKDCATAVGLEGKMTATTESEGLVEWCHVLIDSVLGPYPHAELSGSENSGPKKQGTRMLKLECQSCGCITRTTMKWIESYGEQFPCPCGSVLVLQP